MLGIAVLVILFAGVIGYSARSVRYPVDGTPTGEISVTELSLTHSVERGRDGKLVNPHARKTVPLATPKPKAAVTEKPAPKPAKPAGPTMVEKNVKPAPVVKKPAAKKPALEKVLPKKPAPKKPTVGKPAPSKPPAKKPVDTPARPKACPT